MLLELLFFFVVTLLVYAGGVEGGRFSVTNSSRMISLRCHWWGTLTCLLEMVKESQWVSAISTLEPFNLERLIRTVKMEAIRSLGREALKQDGVTTMQSWILDSFYTMVADPVTAEAILRNCLEKDDSMKMFTSTFGNAILVSSVSEWRFRRKVLNPAFTLKNLNRFVDIFKTKSSILADKLKIEAKFGAVSMYDHIAAYSLDSVFESIYGFELGAQQNAQHPVIKALSVCCELISNRMCLPWLHNQTVYQMTSQWAKLKESAELLFEFIDVKIVKKCKEFEKNTVLHPGAELIQTGQKKPKTILHHMLETSLANNEKLSEAYLREDTFIVTFAGTDTTSVALSFIFTMMARHPAVQEKVYEEIQQVLGEKPIEATDLSQLHYTEAVIKETLRLYPPGPLILRKVDKDIVLPSGKYLVAGTGVMINIWAIHRNTMYWCEDAELFRPERFLESALKHPAAFLTFSYGVRNCIGSHYAMMSLKTSVSTLIRQFQVQPATESYSKSLPSKSQGLHEPLRLQFDVMIRDVDNFTVKLVPRKFP